MRLPFHDPKPRGWQPDEPPSLEGVSTVYLDTETTGLHWHRGDRPVGIAVKPKGGRSVYLPFGHKGGGNLAEAQVREWALRELRGKRIANHSTKFDLLMMRAWGIDLEAQGCTFHDVSHSAALLDDHRMRFNLNELAEDELNGKGKIDPGPKDDLANLPAWMVADYACRDVDLVEELEAVFAPKLRAESLCAVQQLEDQVIPAVAEMEWNGLDYDQEMLDRWLAEIADLEVAYLWRLRRSFGFEVSSGQSVKRAFAALGLEPGKKIRKGNKDQDKNGQEYDSFAYEFIAAHALAHPQLAPLERLTALRSLRSKVFTPLKEGGSNGHYTPTYHQLRSITPEGDTRGVVSGRFSAPLVHQLPGKNKYTKKYGVFRKNDADDGKAFWARELFHEPRGHWFAADASQIQYRIMVHCSESARLLQMYRDDPRTNFHGKVEGWMRPLRPTITETEVKIANFLTIFGGGVNATAQFFGCSKAEAQEFRDIYFAAFPEAQQTIDKVKLIAEGRGWVRSKLGRRSRFPVGTYVDKFGRTRRERMRTHKALNAVCQMNEADIFKTKMVLLHKERKALGLTPRVNLHDEYDGRLEDKAMAPRIIEMLNEQSIELTVPILWKGGVAEGRQTWANAK
jgi:DNA polymerase I-like protein with 3'-5' exonuclease and polymerase domains